ncbi:VOC family protein [Paracoccus sp. pheM1]|uniref:VOC family protein n=1 Tax=Paracoccus sp. pheM1 TaxID=2831675 RepID=UPI001BDB9578|nr:VOC family protein [Paracoccus sp. pheM1]MBT0779358.1 VOC family protein [Paracoccus sp. pheM1]
MMEAPRIYPTFRFRDAAAMIEWLERAFGFTTHAKYMDGDKVAHAELAFGSSMIMCGDDKDDAYGEMVGRLSGQGGKSLYIVVDDVDAMFARAQAAGAAIEEGLTYRDYGSREFICRDPEGNLWCFGTWWPKVTDKD